MPRRKKGEGLGDIFNAVRRGASTVYGKVIGVNQKLKDLGLARKALAAGSALGINPSTIPYVGGVLTTLANAGYGKKHKRGRPRKVGRPKGS